MNWKTTIAVRPAKTLYREGDRVLKLWKDERAAVDVLIEALNLACVGETDLKVPRLHEVTKVEGRWGIIMDYIEGETLAARMEKEKSREGEYLDRFVEIQLEMHRYTAPRLPLHIEKMHRKIRASGLDAAARYELHTRLDSLPRHTKLCHGDYNPGNIIITPRDEACIIDWNHATQGNASADAARTFLLFHLAGQAETAEEYLSLFCEKSGTARQYVEKWLSIVSASQLAKGIPEVQDFLLRWAGVVDYE